MLPDPTGSPPPPRPDFPTHAPRPSAAGRATAVLEVIACSGFPTQLALTAVFQSLGFTLVNPDKSLNVGFVVGLSLVDAVLIVGLTFGFLRAHGERPREVFLGARPILNEAAHGIPLILGALLIAIVVLGSIQAFVPWLRNVPQNPLGSMIRSPGDAWLFALLVVVAGGIREEIQRAFLLHRFEVWLGGGTVGLVVTSAMFGAGHVLQGNDAVIATALLGAFWGVIYLRRRSVVAPMVSHAGFDLLQIVGFLQQSR